MSVQNPIAELHFEQYLEDGAQTAPPLRAARREPFFPGGGLGAKGPNPLNLVALLGARRLVALFSALTLVSVVSLAAYFFAAAAPAPPPNAPAGASPAPFASPSVSASPVPDSGERACVAAALSLLNASTWNTTYFNPQWGAKCRGSGPLPQGFPFPTDGSLGTVLPLAPDLFAAAAGALCPSRVAQLALASLSRNLTQSQVCYFAPFPAESGAPLWLQLVPAGSLWTLNVTPQYAQNRWEMTLPALVAAASQPNAAACKWWFSIDRADSVWVHPRNVHSAVAALPFDAPLVLGAWAYYMLFSALVTQPFAGSGSALFSAAAVRSLHRVLQGNSSGGCLARSLAVLSGLSGFVATSPALWYCLLTEGGVLPVHLPNVDFSGALSGNSVPLEPPPTFPKRASFPLDLRAALLQPHHLATHWAWVDNLVPQSYQAPLLAAYEQVYGAWDVAKAVAAAGAAGAGGGPGCGAAAAPALQALVNATLSASTPAAPLSLDVAGAVIGAACASLLPLPAPRATLFVLAQGDAGDGGSHAEALFSAGWARDYRDNVLAFGAAPPPGSPMRPLPALKGVPASRAGALLLQAAAAALAEGGRALADAPWVLLGADSTVANPQALAGVTARLHPDTPLALAFYVRPTDPAIPYAARATRPMQGLMLLSRAAVARVAPLLGTAACPLDAVGDDVTEDGGVLGRCLWLAGAVPVHTLLLDPFGFVPILVDWSFQTVQTQNGFVASSFTYSNPPEYLPRVYGLRRSAMQVAYCACANLSGACASG